MTDIREQLIDAGRDLYLTGIVSTRAGNLSARDSDTILITRTGAPLGRLTKDDFIEVSVSKPDERDVEASSDLVIHRQVYRDTDARVLVHGHGTDTIIWTFDGRAIEPADHEGALLVPRVAVHAERYDRTSLAADLASELGSGCPIVAVAAHGTYAIGQTVFEAAHWTTCIEQSCRILRGLNPPR